MDIWDRALGFMDSQVLLTAHALGVFEALARGPCHLEEVARATELPTGSAARLLCALCSQGLVERTADGRYQNGQDAARQLVRGAPGYIGDMFHHLQAALYPVWGHLTHALKEGRAQWERAFPGGPSPTESMYESEETLRRFMDGMHAITSQSARDLAAQADWLEEVGSIVDVGGASGAFVLALAGKHPSLRGTVFDLPAVRPIAEEKIALAGLGDRVRFVAGDFWVDALPAGADAYALGFILHDWDDAGGDILLGKIARAAPAGARLVLGEYVLEEDRTGPHFVARQDLNMLVAARGRERTRREYADWLARHGFSLERAHDTAGGKCFLVFRRR